MNKQTSLGQSPMVHDHSTERFGRGICAIAVMNENRPSTLFGGAGQLAHCIFQLPSHSLHQGLFRSITSLLAKMSLATGFLGEVHCWGRKWLGRLSSCFLSRISCLMAVFSFEITPGCRGQVHLHNCLVCKSFGNASLCTRS